MVEWQFIQRQDMFKVDGKDTDSVDLLLSFYQLSQGQCEL